MELLELFPRVGPGLSDATFCLQVAMAVAIEHADGHNVDASFVNLVRHVEELSDATSLGGFPNFATAVTLDLIIRLLHVCFLWMLATTPASMGKVGHLTGASRRYCHG